MGQFLDSSRLAITQTVGGGDLLPIYSQGAGLTQAVPLSAIATFIQSLLVPSSQYIEYYSVPLTGAVIPDDGKTYNKWFIIQPAGTIANLTVTFPSFGIAIDGQEMQLTSTQTITTLTIVATGSTVIGANAGLSSTTPITFKYNQPLNVWLRFGS